MGQKEGDDIGIDGELYPVNVHEQVVGACIWRDRHTTGVAIAVGVDVCDCWD